MYVHFELLQGFCLKQQRGNNADVKPQYTVAPVSFQTLFPTFWAEEYIRDELTLPKNKYAIAYSCYGT
jgi:hypothetical protein